MRLKYLLAIVLSIVFLVLSMGYAVSLRLENTTQDTSVVFATYRILADAEESLTGYQLHVQAPHGMVLVGVASEDLQWAQPIFEQQGIQGCLHGTRMVQLCEVTPVAGRQILAVLHVAYPEGAQQPTVVLEKAIGEDGRDITCQLIIEGLE